MIKNNTLVACYTVFNGEELLEKSMKQIDSEVDLFIICYQHISNKGQSNPDLAAYLSRFADNDKVLLLKYTPDLRVNTKVNERIKHQLMIDFARVNGASHVFLAACDHFYQTNQFKFAKELSICNDLDVTYTRMFTFYKNPTWQITPLEEYYMPFIIKLKDETKFSSVAKSPVLVDPSVKVNNVKRYSIFQPSECILYHYSMIRQDIKSKFQNAAASIRWKAGDIEKFISEYENYNLETNEGVSYFGGRKIKVVDNYFDL